MSQTITIDFGNLEDHTEEELIAAIEQMDDEEATELLAQLEGN